MNKIIVLAMYLAMLVFDVVILAGTVEVIDRGWSPWWMAFAVLMCAGANPKFLILIMK